ncbi:MAG: bifunctional 4-hydroxy-2-oxoglutarate aldolase/2-dehydro-3-deoxy-phosphogluconate aldolase [Clostridia bacterium]|nr:bifunctional 4-hydroxy-2-oxoglutarate aldolase/2-dehydro-3-deoxy-phosphogluconate aldolase [Clostridia bacterium]
MSNIIEDHGLIVIFRGVALDKIPAVTKALIKGGAKVVEVAFNPSDPNTIKNTTDIIKKVIETAGDKLMVGAGTVISKEYVEAAYKAGAKFIFSPNTDTEIILYTKAFGLISIPGAFTPSEVMTAYKAGADIIKMFPITVDDIGYLVNITRPLSHIPFICVGGTNPDTIEAFIKAGAKGVGTGISILKPELIENGDYEEITRLTKLHIEKINKARGGI